MTTHTSWCTPGECIPGINEDNTMHVTSVGESSGFRFEISQFENAATPVLGVLGEGDLTLPQVDELITTLTAARERLARIH